MSGRRRWVKWMVVASVLLLFLAWLGLVILFAREPDGSDARAVMAPLLVMPLSEVPPNRAIRKTVRVPTSDHWRRIRSSWGEPEFLVTLAGEDDGSAACIDQTSLKVEVRLDGRPAPILERRFGSYRRGFAPMCEQGGVLHFHASVGEEIEMTVLLNDSHRRTGKLILEAEWKGQKDKLVGTSLTDLFRETFYLPRL